MRNPQRKSAPLSLTGKVGYISLGRGLAALSSLVAGMLLSRYLTRSDYGTYKQLWLIYSTLYPLFSLGLPTSINYFIPQATEKEKGAFNLQTFFLLTLGGAIISLVFFLGAPEFARIFHNPDLTPMARVFAFIPILTLPTLYYQNLFISLDQPVLVAKLSIALSAGRLIAIFVPIILRQGLLGILVGLISFSIVQFLLVAYLMFRPFGICVASWQYTLLLRQLRYAIPIGLSFIVGTWTKQIDKMAISTFFSPSQYAIYVNGAIEVPLIGVFTGSVTAVLMPEFVRLYVAGNIDRLVFLWHRAIRKVGLIILPVMVFLFLYAPEFLTLLFSEKYAGSAGVFRVFLLALPTRVTTFGTILLAAGLSTLVMRYSVYTLLLNAVLAYSSVQLIGFSGPAIGTVLAIYFIAALQLREIAKLLHMNFTSVFPWSDLGRIAFIALAAGIVSAVPKEMFSLPLFLRFLMGSFIYAATFLPLVVKVGLLKKDDILAFWRAK